jgi:hypothetical protein
MQIAHCLFRLAPARLLVAALLLAAAAGAAAQTQKGPILKAGESLKSGEAMTSRNGKFSASFAFDGNFILYQGATPVWSTGTGKRTNDAYRQALANDGNRAVVSTDGSFVIAGTGPDGAPVALFNSKSGGKPAGNYFLLLRDDGWLTLYVGTDPSQPAGGLWTSGGVSGGTLAPPLSTQLPALSAAQRAQLSPAQLAAYDADPVVVKAKADAAAAAAAATAKAAADAAAIHTVLKAGETLKAGEYLVSPGKTFFALMQADGNFVVVRGSGPANAKDVISDTKTKGAGNFAAMQADGNFVIYSAAGKPLFDTVTWGLGNGDYTAVLQDDGSLVVRGTSANKQPVLWSSATGPNPAFATAGGAKVAADAAAAKKAAADAEAKKAADPAYQAAKRAEQQEAAASIAKANAAKEAAAEAARQVALAKDKAEAEAMQKKRVDDAAAKAKTDAAYILANTYRHSGEALTAGQELMSLDLDRNYYAVMQDDGNLVIYALGNGKTPEERRKTQKQTWSSGTGGRTRGAYSAVMQADGNLVIYAPNKSVVWSSSSGANKPSGNYYVRLGATGQLLISMGLDTSRSYIPLWTSGTGVIPDPLPIQRFPPTVEQRAWLSPGQNAWAIAWAPTAEQHAELVKQQNIEVALIRAKNEEAANLAAWKRQTAEFEKTRGVYCPDQLSDDRVAGQGRSDTEPLTVSTKRLGDTMATTTIRTRNCLPKPVWITIYDVTKLRQLDYGCVAPHSLRDWQGGTYLAGVYFVRAEVKAEVTKDCTGANVPGADTTIQANVDGNYLGAAMNFDAVQDVKNKNYYWEHPVKVGKGTISAAGKMFTDLGEETGITDAMRKAWNLITGNCAIVAEYMPDPLTAYMKVAEAYGPASLQTPAQCYHQGLESFYCQFPAELGRQVSGSGSNASALPALGERLWNESKTEECRYFYALTPVIPGAPMFCAMSKLVIEDSKKAVQCAIAAERTGAVKEMLASAHDFPSEESCRGFGEVAFKVAMKVATGGKQQPGSGGTVKAMAQEFRTIYKAAGVGAAALDRFEKKLASIPACRD